MKRIFHLGPSVCMFFLLNMLVVTPVFAEAPFTLSKNNKKGLDAFAKATKAPLPKGAQKVLLSKGAKKSVKIERKAIVVAAHKTKTEPKIVMIHGKPVEILPETPVTKLSPHKDPLPGGEYTLSQYETVEKPKVAVKYKLNDKASAIASLNQTDETSPLYVPETGNSRLSSTDIGVETELQENLTMQMRAEYRNHGDIYSTKDENSSGASVGLKYAF